jgi:hypothetical protein
MSIKCCKNAPEKPGKRGKNHSQNAQSFLSDFVENVKNFQNLDYFCRKVYNNGRNFHITQNPEGGRTMPNTCSIVKSIDNEGRINLSKEIRRALHITQRDALKITVDETNRIIIEKETSQICPHCGQKY